MRKATTTFLSLFLFSLFLFQPSYSQSANTCVENTGVSMEVVFQGDAAKIFENGDIITAEGATSGDCYGDVTVNRNGNQPISIEVWGNSSQGGASDGETLAFMWYRGNQSQSLTIDRLNSGQPPVTFSENSKVRVLAVSEDAIPVELTAFNAVVSNGNVNLNWNTQSETNNAGFHVLRNGNEIGFVEGNGTTSVENTYNFTDNTATPGQTHTYRLSQVDYDGTVEQHPEIEVLVPVPSVTVSEVYPNPSTSPNVDVYDENVTIEIYNVLGQRVRIISDKRGTVNLGGFATGRYILKVESENSTETRLFTVSN